MKDGTISRQAAIIELAFSKETGAMTCGELKGVFEVLKRLPSVQPQQTCEYWDSESKFCALCRPFAQPERKKGRWIRNDNGTYSCSVCQSWIPEEQHYYARYCLYCGTDMRKEEMIE